MSVAVLDRLSQLNIQLPTPAAPVANYIGATISGHLLLTSGQLPLQEGQLLYTGRLGETVSEQQGREAARLCAINVLAQAQAALGDLSRIQALVKLTVFVSSTAEFYNHPLIANGASDFFVDILGEKGKHTRSAVGVAALPLNAPVEVEAIFEITPA